ncbi:MAG TPA: efflux RND transporter periplasmic adaptor subunit [bacterium]|nr:efflux RND transporter periplasmic adaptor subunit [bacterium]
MRVQHVSSAAMLMALTFALAGCQSGNQAQNTIARIPVVTAPVVREDISRTLSFSGSVEGIRQATVSARLAETIARVHVRKGDAVRAGQVVVSFDQSGPATSVRQAQAVYEDAKKTLEKYDRLFAAGAVSELERDARRTAYEVAKADFEAARDAANVLAPLTGIVTDVRARAGRQTTPGEALVEIAAIDTVRVLIDATVYEARALAKGMPMRIQSQLDSAAYAAGWVDQIASSADPDTRMLRVEALAPNLEGRLLPGMFITVGLELERIAGAVAVPREALVYRESGLGAFVVRDSLAHYTPVTVGAESGTRVQITNGLTPGETVVVLGQHSLQDQSPVNPVPQTAVR